MKAAATAVMFGKAAERILSRCIRIGECLVWQGYRADDGYGAAKVAGKMLKVHRVVWQATHGEIPIGMEIDHVKARGCTSRACCNIEHLEAVTRRENVLRSDSPGALHARKTHCPKGHPLSGDNLVKSETQARRCLICTRERKKLRMREVRARK